MNIIYLLIILSVILVVIIAIVFLWAVKNDQFEDLEKHSHEILMDDDKPGKNKK